MKKSLKTAVKSVGIFALGLAAAFCLILKTEEVQNAVKSSVDVCLYTLIPSMCGFMILCSFLVNSGVFRVILKPFKKPVERYLHISTELLAVIVLSQIGGYPVGIKLCNDLISYNKNYSEICYKLVPALYASGPAFLSGVAGMTIYKDVTGGVIIFISCLIANIAVALFILLRNKGAACVCSSTETDFSADTVVRSVKSSFSALAVVCMFVISFNLVSELVLCFLPVEISSGKYFIYLRCLWEISNIRLLSPVTPLWVTAFFCGFGGVCVVMQIVSVSCNRVKLFGFAVKRVVVSFITAFICFCIENIIDYNYNIEVNYLENIVKIRLNPIVICCFLAMSIILLRYFEKNFKKNQKNFKKRVDLLK